MNKHLQYVGISFALIGIFMIGFYYANISTTALSLNCGGSPCITTTSTSTSTVTDTVTTTSTSTSTSLTTVTSTSSDTVSGTITYTTVTTVETLTDTATATSTAVVPSTATSTITDTIAGYITINGATFQGSYATSSPTLTFEGYSTGTIAPASFTVSIKSPSGTITNLNLAQGAGVYGPQSYTMTAQGPYTITGSMVTSTGTVIQVLSVVGSFSGTNTTLHTQTSLEVRDAGAFFLVLGIVLLAYNNRKKVVASV